MPIEMAFSLQANVLLDLKKECPILRRIIMTKPIADELRLKASEVQVELFQFSQVSQLELEQTWRQPNHTADLPRPADLINLRFPFQVESIGEKNLRHPIPPHKDQLAVICYTSGTTGNPKGVMLSHRNILANLSAVMFQMGEWAPNGQDTMLSFLPLAHMFERCCEMAVYMVGGCVGFYSGDIRGLMEDMQVDNLHGLLRSRQIHRQWQCSRISKKITRTRVGSTD